MAYAAANGPPRQLIALQTEEITRLPARCFNFVASVEGDAAHYCNVTYITILTCVTGVKGLMEMLETTSNQVTG